MVLGLGLGLGLSGGSAVIINDAITLFTGQSLHDRLFNNFSGAGADAFEAEAANYFTGTVSTNDGAVSNQFLTESAYDESGETGGRYFWADTTSSKGSQYTNTIDSIANKDTYTALIIALGESDALLANHPHDATEYTAFYKEFIAQLHSDFPNAQIFLNIIGRNKVAGDNDSKHNMVKQSLLNVIADVSYVKKGVENYDIALTDNVHFAEAGTELYAEREARVIAKGLGKAVYGAYGPSVGSLIDRTDRIYFTVTHDDGTDWTAPTSGRGMFTVEDDGTAINPESIVRTSATEGYILLPEGTAPLHGSTVTAFTNYGDGGHLGATPDVAKDNATNALPFQTAFGIAPTQGDAVKALDNLEFRMHSRGCAKTYSATNIIDTIASLAGSDFSVIGSGTGPEFTGGYVEFARGTDGIITDDVLTTSAARTLGICGKMPTSIPSFGTLAGFTNAAGVWSNNARFYLHTGGFLNYAAVDSGTTPLHGSGAFTGGKDFIVFLRFNDATELEAFVNSTTVTATLDPQGTYAASDKKLAFGEPSNQNGLALQMKIYDAFLTSDAITDTELVNIYDFWGEQFSLTFYTGGGFTPAPDAEPVPP